jgi:4-amino-4-deoxy-L-arabinose transferase-like glycosyltransferase
MTVDMARRFGGRATAQLAAAVVLTGTFFLAAGHLASTTTFDLLAWTAVLWLAVRLLDGADPRPWLAVGLVGGLGLENKALIAMLAAGLGLGVLAARRFDVLRTPWLWAGAGLAIVIWLPNLAWQASNDWPQLTMARRLAQRAATEGGFLEQAILLSGGPLIVVPIIGLGRLLASGVARPWRALGWATIAVIGLVVLTGGKSYYLAGILPPLVASGAVALVGWLGRGRARLRSTAAGAVAAAWIVALALIVLPIVPPASLATTPIPEVFGESIEQIGWPELVSEVQAAADTLTPEERAVAMILTANYGEAGTLELIGGDLPPVFSGHNGYWDWGPPPDDRSIVIAVVSRGWRPAEIADCVTTGRVANEFGLHNEEYGASIQVCRRAPSSWAEVWPRFRHLD